MRKLFVLITSILVSLFLAGYVSAATPSLTARIEQPKSPTNINELDITVVTLDREGRAITVKCFKKAPADAGFIQFGSDIAVTPGGNSVHCETNSTILPGDGTYLFYAESYAGSDVATTATVSVDYNTSGPGTPTNYSKEKPSDCTYKIRFRSADDSGKTIKVNVYRSENTSFSLDSGTLVGTVNLGSNTDGELLNTVPDCNKTYYYAIRAFDSAGNGSGVVGDSEVHTTTTTTASSTSQTQGGTSGAARGALAAGTAGNVLGQAVESTPEAGQVQGDATPAAVEQYTTAAAKRTGGKAVATVLGILGVLVVIWLLRKRKTSQTV